MRSDLGPRDRERVQIPTEIGERKILMIGRLKSSVLAVIRAGWGGEGSVELLVWAEAGDASWLEEIDVGVGRVLALLYLAAGNNVSVPHPLAV